MREVFLTTFAVFLNLTLLLRLLYRSRPDSAIRDEFLLMLFLCIVGFGGTRGVDVDAQ